MNIKKLANYGGWTGRGIGKVSEVLKAVSVLTGFEYFIRQTVCLGSMPKSTKTDNRVCIQQRLYVK
jgi:hypothetical protein